MRTALASMSIQSVFPPLIGLNVQALKSVCANLHFRQPSPLQLQNAMKTEITPCVEDAYQLASFWVYHLVQRRCNR
jgi:hypothetical protein